MSIHYFLEQTASGVLASVELIEPAAAQSAVDAYELTAGRLWSVPAILLGLTGLVFAGIALSRTAGRVGNRTGRRTAIAALLTGPIGAVLGCLIVLAADGGPGTGGGVVGGYLAVLTGLTGTILGGTALVRSRAAGTPVTTPRAEH